MHPVIAALKHHKTAVILMALEVAMTCAIITNALSVIGGYLGAMNVTTGVADNELVWATTRKLDLGTKTRAPHGAGLVAADLAALRTIPGVRSVAIMDALPLDDYTRVQQVFRHRGDAQSALTVGLYLGTRGIVNTLGVQLVQGRRFEPQEFVNWGPSSPPPTAAIITRKLAEKLWPGQDPLGKPIYFNKSGSEVTYVVGVVKHLLNSVYASHQGAQSNMILPVQADSIQKKYVLRVSSNRRMAVKRAIPRVLLRVDPARTVQAYVYTDSLARHFHDKHATIVLLIAVIACLLAITALGLVGLSSFWVQQRTRTIGIRRALGATRRSILHYFQIENFLIVTVGVVLGVVLAVALNVFLLQHYQLRRMPLWYLGVGALVLWCVGQLAVLGPALRGSRISPMAATRCQG